MRLIALILILCMYCIIGSNTAAVAGNFSQQDAINAITTFGPIMKLHPSEEYLMDDPKSLLEDPANRNWLFGAIIPNEDDYKAWRDQRYTKFYQNSKSYAITSSNLIGMNPQVLFPDYGKTNFHYYVKFNDKVIHGQQNRASRIIAVKEHGQFLYVTYWFFYPYNGPGRAFVSGVDNKQEERGRHYGDWEHVTTRIAKNGTGLKLTGLFLSRHAFSPWYGDLSKFSMRGTHPIIYIAINSHAHYPEPHDYIYAHETLASTIPIEVYDSPRDGGTEFDTSKDERRIIVASNVAGLNPDATQQGWWQFKERWGQYLGNRTDFKGVPLPDTTVERGPTAPISKDPDEIHFVEQNDSIAFARATNSAGFLDVLALAEDIDSKCCSLQHNYLNSFSLAWNGWQENFLNAPRVTAVVGGAFKGDAHFFIIGKADKKVYHAWLNNKGWRQNWNDPNFPDSGKVLVEGFGVWPASDGDHAEVFAVRESDGALLHTWTAAYEGGWQSPWQADFSGFPRNIKFLTTAKAFNSLVVVALKSDGTPVFSDCPGGNWRWAAAIPNAPTLQSLQIAGDNPLQLLGVGTDQHLWHTTYLGNGQWSGWDKDFMGAPTSVKFVSMAQGPHLEAFLVKQDGTMIHTYNDGNWHAWDNSGFPSPTVPSRRALAATATAMGFIPMMAALAITQQDEVAVSLQLNYTWGGWTTMLFDGSANLKPN